MTTRKHLADIRALVESAGLRLLAEPRTNGTNHLVAEVEAPDGRARKYAMPCTPSDHRWRKNALRDLRRIARGIEP